MLNFYTELLFFALVIPVCALYRLAAPRLTPAGRAWALAGLSLPFLALLRGGAGFLPWLALCVAGLWLGGRWVRASGRRGGWLLAFLVASMVGLLALAKHPQYVSWLPVAGPVLAGASGWGWLGFSYLSFRAIDYLFQARRGALAAGLAETAALGLFFAPYVSGPINRIAPLVTDLAASDPPLTFARLRDALLRTSLGIVKMLFLARWAYYASVAAPEFLDTRLPGLPGLALGTWAYYLYIYLDFSGYCDVAIALGGLFGVRLPENFDRPFLAANLQEFWNRWHMSLSQWFRDYVFFPAMATLRRRCPRLPGQLALSASLFATFLLMGAWHGDGPNWACYGLYHGAGMALWSALRWWQNRLAPEFFAALRENRLWRMAATAFTFNYVSFGLLLMLDPATFWRVLGG